MKRRRPPKTLREFFARARAALDRLTADTAEGRSLRGALRTYVRDVKAGADPIEALHGHKCGPKCWHNMKVR